MLTKLHRFWEEILSYSRQEKLVLLFAMICSFCITSEYAITKPASNSIFLAHYPVTYLPYAWLATVPLNFLAVSFYNRLLNRLGSFRMCLCFIGVTLVVNLSSAFFPSSLAFLLYVWKDIYVLLMFQQLWSVIHSVIKSDRAKYLYGFLFGIGGVGAIMGSVVPGFFAVAVGSEHLLLMTLPIYLIFATAYFFFLKQSGFLKESIKEKEQGHFLEGFQLIRQSKPLRFILLIVVLMQVMATIMDFEFNTFLAMRYPEQDVRTQFSGRLFGTINTLNLCLQFVATFLVVHLFGLKRSHFLVPVILLINAVGCLFYPGFAFVTYSFVVIKTFDFSIFNIIKEMLYLPLKKVEKFKAKAIIDVFAYRSAKAGASLCVLALQFFFPERLPYAFMWVPLILATTWIFSVYFLMKEGDFAIPETNPTLEEQVS